MTELRDWRGTPIEVGSHVVYPGRYSSSLWVNEAEVIEIFEQKTEYYGPRPALKVRRIRDTHGACEGTSTLTRLDKVTVVPSEQV